MSSRKKRPDVSGVTKPRRQAASAPPTKPAPKPKSSPAPRRALQSTRPDLIRCDWAGSDPLYVTYHDQEWGVPLHDDRVLFEFLVLEGAQAGLSWITILRKRDSYRRAFAEFDPAIVARFGERDLERLLADPGIVRNRQKIESAIVNARAYLQVQEEFGSFDAYSWRFRERHAAAESLSKWAVLRAGYGAAGRKMMDANHRLSVDDHSMIGNAILKQQAQIASDVAGEESRFKNPFLPDTRSEMALPLIAKSEALGALTVQSHKLNAFSEEDITSLQVMADHIAIALSNAQLMDKLTDANAEILRTKTYEAIATATGEAIHWVGNKAAPIPGSIKRVREDLGYLLALIGQLDESAWLNESLRAAVETVREEAEMIGLDLKAVWNEMSTMKPNRLSAEGLEII